MPIPPLKWQVEHIEENLDAFHDHAGDDVSPAEYLYQYASYKDGEIYERLCADLGITPRTAPTEGNNVADTVSPTDRQRLEMQLQMNMETDGTNLTPERRAEIEALLGTDVTVEAGEPVTITDTSTGEEVTLTTEQLLALGHPMPTAEEADEVMAQFQQMVTGQQPDLSTMIQQAVAQAVGQAGLNQVAQPVSLEDVLLAIDPADSEAALLLLEWLQGTGRLSVVATLAGSGGYLFHYAEPKGATKEGYVPGGTQGGRMVDAAMDQAKAAGAVKKNVGLCDKCWSAVEKLDDGSIVTSDETQSAACSAGGPHTFNA